MGSLTTADLVHALTGSIAAAAEGLSNLSYSIYDEDDHRLVDFHDRYCEAVSGIMTHVDNLAQVSKEIDEEVGINRTRVDPRLVAARAALRDIQRGKTDDPVKRAEEGLEKSLR